MKLKCESKLVLFLVIIFLIAFFSNVSAVFYESYNYNFWGEVVPAPQAYVPYQIIDFQDQLEEGLSKPRGLYVQDNNIYIVDTQNNRIIHSDEDWQIIDIYETFQNGQKEDSFNNPHGIFVTEKGEMYIADRNNGRIVQLDHRGELMRVITGPEEEIGTGILPEDFEYQPEELVVDQAGRIYVIASQVYNGIMSFNLEGEFTGFIGAPRVSPNMTDFMWRRFATDEQRKRMSLFLPTQYDGLDISDDGFIYATVSGGSIREEEAVRKLNPSGEDVLRRTGFFPPVGDIEYPPNWMDVSVTGASVFVDITTQDNEIFSALDKKRGRIFTYDKNGNLLYLFGGKGRQKGLFANPVSIDILDELFLVLDSTSEHITTFKPTQYAKSITSALSFYDDGLYEKAATAWKNVLSYNSNYDQAYTGIGRSLHRQGNFAEALDNFRIANNRPGFSKSLEYYRREVVNQNFHFVIYSLLFVIIIFIVLKKIRKHHLVAKVWSNIEQKYLDTSFEKSEIVSQNKKSFFNRSVYRLIKTLQGLKYALHVVFHPFGGFWDLKHEKKGNMFSSVTIVILVIFSYIIMRQYTGFIFNEINLSQLNIYAEASSIILPFILWCTVNWALTTLMDGKGKMRDIINVTAYSLTPIILINIPITVISNYLVAGEGGFYYFFTSLGVIWSMVLIFTGTLVIHEYTLSKTIQMVLLIIMGMGSAIFIGLIFFSVIDFVANLVTDIYKEIALR
ncbi:MAG: YIP1 family protein [Bacillota bacterium]